MISLFLSETAFWTKQMDKPDLELSGVVGMNTVDVTNCCSNFGVSGISNDTEENQCLEEVATGSIHEISSNELPPVAKELTIVTQCAKEPNVGEDNGCRGDGQIEYNCNVGSGSADPQDSMDNSSSMAVAREYKVHMVLVDGSDVSLPHTSVDEHDAPQDTYISNPWISVDNILKNQMQYLKVIGETNSERTEPFQEVGYSEPNSSGKNDCLRNIHTLPENNFSASMSCAGIKGSEGCEEVLAKTDVNMVSLGCTDDTNVGEACPMLSSVCRQPWQIQIEQLHENGPYIDCPVGNAGPCVEYVVARGSSKVFSGNSDDQASMINKILLNELHHSDTIEETYPSSEILCELGSCGGNARPNGHVNIKSMPENNCICATTRVKSSTPLDNKSPVHDSEVVNLVKESSVSAAFLVDNMDETRCTMPIICDPCERKSEPLHENVLHEAVTVEQIHTSVEQGVLNAFCDVPEERSSIQVFMIDKHMKCQVHCLGETQETDGDNNEIESVSFEVGTCNEGTQTVTATSLCNDGPLTKEKEIGNTVSKPYLPPFRLCNSKITEEMEMEMEMSGVNVANNTILLVEKGVIVDKEGAKNAGQVMETESACSMSTVISAECHTENQILIPDSEKNQSIENTGYLTRDLYYITSHSQGNNFIPEDGASLPVSENSSVLDSTVISGLMEGQVNSVHQSGKASTTTIPSRENAGTSACGEVDQLLIYPKGDLVLTLGEGSIDKTCCNSLMTQEAPSTKLLEQFVLYDANYCREGGILGQIEETINTNELPHEPEERPLSSVEYSPETASSNPLEETTSPSSPLSMSQQIESKGATTSMCCSSAEASLVPLTCDNDNSAQANKSFDSKSSTSTAAVRASKSIRLSRRKNITRQCRKTGTAVLLSHSIHVLSSKIARRKRNEHHKQRRLSCWGAVENLMQFFAHDDSSLCSRSLNDHMDLRVRVNKSETAKGKLWNKKASKRSKVISTDQRHTDAKKAVKRRQKKLRVPLSCDRKKCVEAGNNYHKDEALENVIISDLPTEPGGLRVTSVEDELPDGIDSKAADRGSGSKVAHSDDDINHVQHSGSKVAHSDDGINHVQHSVEKIEEFVAKTSSGDSSRVCQEGSETCMGSLHEDLKTNCSENTICIKGTHPFHTKGLSESHFPNAEFLASHGSCAISADLEVRSDSTTCQGIQNESFTSKDLEKVGLTIDDSSICENAAGTVLPMRTYSKKRKSPSKDARIHQNSGDTSKTGNSFNGQPREKASSRQPKSQSTNLSKQKNKKGKSVSRRKGKMNCQGEPSRDAKTSSENLGKKKSQRKKSVKRRELRINCQAEAFRSAEMPSNALHTDEKAGKEPRGIHVFNGLPSSSRVPEKTALFKEYVTGALQTPGEHETKKTSQSKKDSRNTCRSKCSSSLTHQKGRRIEMVKKISQKLNKFESGELRENDHKEKESKNAATTEPGSKIAVSEVKRTDPPQQHINNFRGKLSLNEGHQQQPGVDATADDKCGFATSTDILHSDIIYEVEESSAPSRLAWVSCDDCHKWRNIPAELADSIGDSDCRWICKDNTDTRFADCSIPQEKSNAEINAELNISEGSCDEEFSRPPRFSNSHQSVQLSVAQQAKWRNIKHNVFLNRIKKTQTIDEVMVCHCKPPQGSGLGCGDECLNRMLNIECIQGTCPCGPLCSNQQFQKQKYAKFKWFRCGKKGYGLQLEENVSQGQFLIEYVGEVLDSQMYEARQREYAARGQQHFYFMTLNNSEVIDACFKGNLGRFINHSCDPNCRTEKWMVNGEVCIGLFALRDINKGEEVTFDYNYVRVFGAAAKKCFCGASNCMGYIGGDPTNTETVIESDSEENFPVPEMVMEDEQSEHPEVNRVVKNTLPVHILPPETSPGTANSKDNLSLVSGAAATPIETHEIEHSIPDQVTCSKVAVVKNAVHVPSKQLSLQTADAKKKSPERNIKNPEHPHVLVKSSKTTKKSKHGHCQGKNAKIRRVLLVADKNRFEGVEEKLNDLLDVEGGINKQKDAAKGYLKLLFITASSGDNVNQGSYQSIRDLSIVLDAILKTKSRTVLVDIINKNGLQMLHNIVKQNRKNFNKTPIIRKLLKVLEFLAGKDVLTLEHIIAAPPCTGMESFRESIMALTWHNDVQVQQMARSFRDKYVPQTIRKARCHDREDGISQRNRHPHKHWQSQVARQTDAINCASSSASEFISDSLKRFPSTDAGQTCLSENMHWEDILSNGSDTVTFTAQQVELPSEFHNPIKIHPATTESGSRCREDLAIDIASKWVCGETNQLCMGVGESKRRKRKSRWEPLDENLARQYYVKQKVNVGEKHSNVVASSVTAQIEGSEQLCGPLHVHTCCVNGQFHGLDSANSEAGQPCAHKVSDSLHSDKTQLCQSSSGASPLEVANPSGPISVQVSPSYCNSQVSVIQQEKFQRTQPTGSGCSNWPAPNHLPPSAPSLPPDPHSSQELANDSVPPGFEGTRQSLHRVSASQFRLPAASDNWQKLPPGGSSSHTPSMGRRPSMHRWNSRHDQKMSPHGPHHREFKCHLRNEPKKSFGFHRAHMRPPMCGRDSNEANSPNAIPSSLGSVRCHRQSPHAESYDHQPNQKHEVDRTSHRLQVHQHHQQ